MLKISANNKVIPDLSLADIITTVENLTLDKAQAIAFLTEDWQGVF